MVSGQMLDLLAEKMPNPVNPEHLIRRIEEMKTGRLLRFAVEAGQFWAEPIRCSITL